MNGLFATTTRSAISISICICMYVYLLAAILAAAIHDHDHPGLNNALLVATRHEWAVRYNDQVRCIIGILVCIRI